MNRHQRRTIEATQQRQHYFLAAAEIVYQVTPEGPDAKVGRLEAIRQNTLVISKDGRITVVQLARTQQAMQKTFLGRMSGVGKIEIADVVITAMMPLGQFTHAEFNAKSSNAELQAQLDAAMADQEAEAAGE